MLFLTQHSGFFLNFFCLLIFKHTQMYNEPSIGPAQKLPLANLIYSAFSSNSCLICLLISSVTNGLFRNMLVFGHYEASRDLFVTDF